MRIPWTVLLFSATAVLFAPARATRAQEQPQDQQQPSTRIYDVRDLVRYATLYLPVAAGGAPYVQTEDVASEDPIQLIEIADLVQLLRDATAPEYWEQEGVEMRAEDSGFLAVHCSGAMQARLRHALVRLRRMLLEQVVVEVLELPGTVLDGQPAVLDSAAIKELLQQAGAQRRFVGRATINQPLLLEATDVRNSVSGLDMEVAENAAVPDPIIDTRGYGASWMVRVVRTTGDAMLVSFSGSDRALERSDSPRAIPTGGDGRQAALQLPTVRVVTYDACARLLPGQGLLLGSSTAAGKVLCVRVRPVGPPVEHDLGEVTAFPVRALVGAAGCGALGVDLWVPNEAAALFPESECDPLPAVFDEGRLMELIMSTVSPDEWDGCPHTMCFLDGTLYVRADAPTRAAVSELLGSLESVDSPQFSLEVRFGDIASEAMNVSLIDGIDELAAALPQRCLSILSASRGVRLAATRHRAVVKDFKTVIARGIGVAAPEVGSVAEGFLLRGELAPLDSRFVRLDLNLTLAQDVSNGAVFDLQDPRFGKIDKIDVRENKVRGVCTVQLGRWTLMQLAPVPGTDRHIAVVARVTAL